MFVGDLNRDPNKLQKFQYSKFSPFGSLIKKEKGDGGVPLKDVVAFIQTNLIKLYVEREDQQSIYNFFQASHNKNQFHMDYNEIDQFLERQENKKICNITKALILENLGKLDKAL